MHDRITALLVLNPSGPLEELRAALESQSIEVLHARTCGEAACSLWSETPPQLVFTDAQLPDGNWSDVLKLARKAAASVNVIVVSPVADVVFYLEAIECGAFDFLTPPYTSPLLAEAVEAAVTNVLLRRYERSRLAAGASG
jgi:DNA-binding NtrC family response regulator